MITHPRGDNSDPRRVEGVKAWESGWKRISSAATTEDSNRGDCNYPNDGGYPMGNGGLGI